MSGHSRWATIKRKKGATDAKRGAQFTKCAKEITLAARAGGGNIDTNARLRAAITAAKAVNMPAANVDRAIKKGTGEIEGLVIEEIVYEGYAPGGVAVYVETATDNKNRTFPELRKIFEKHGGSMGAANSVAFMFHKKGVIVVDASATTEEKLMEVALEAGADDIEEMDGSFEVTTPPSSFHAVLRALEEAKIATVSNNLAMVPTSSIRVEGRAAEQVLRLVEALEDHDDVQHVFANFDIDEQTLAAHQAG
jgi:YebC/PmpR family DNA-binding regulatory protein